MLKTLLLTCILVATTANAQVDDLIETLRSDVKTHKIEIITRAMSFNDYHMRPYILVEAIDRSLTSF